MNFFAEALLYAKIKHNHIFYVYLNIYLTLRCCLCIFFFFVLPWFYQTLQVANYQLLMYAVNENHFQPRENVSHQPNKNGTCIGNCGRHKVLHASVKCEIQNINKYQMIFTFKFFSFAVLCSVHSVVYEKKTQKKTKFFFTTHQLISYDNDKLRFLIKFSWQHYFFQTKYSMKDNKERETHSEKIE